MASQQQGERLPAGGRFSTGKSGAGKIFQKFLPGVLRRGEELVQSHVGFWPTKEKFQELLVGN